MAKVSILMNCYNGEKYLREALDSVVNQTFPDWELIFVDNWSTDGSLGVLASYQDERMKLFTTPQHCPLGEAREFGLGQCQGEYIAFLDTDDVWCSEKLELQIASMDKLPLVSLSYGSYCKIDEFGRLKKQIKLIAKCGDLFGENLADYQVNFQSLVVRAEALRNIARPWFNPDLQFSPDYNLVMRLLFVGEGLCLGECLIKYRISADSLTKRSLARWGLEMQQTLSELQCEPIFSEKISPGQLDRARAKIAYYKAAAAIQNGDCRRARHLLVQYSGIDFRYRVLYWAAFFKFTWMLIHRFKG